MSWYLKVLKNYVGFTGRARRKEYWMFFLVNYIICVVLAIVDNMSETPMLTLIYSLAVMLPSLAVLVRRLHDTGRSGWWFFISIIPFVGSIILLVFTCMDSEMENKYGYNPKISA
jgi:uncharacterized membrane protein YhaH (DUF805 family)